MPNSTEAPCLAPDPSSIIPGRLNSSSALSESILALLESAACQMSDPDLVRHFHQVIKSKRQNIPASQRP